MINLSGKRILLIAPNYYNYHTEVISALEKLGADVLFFEEMNNSLLYRISKKTSGWLKEYLQKKHLDHILKNIDNKQFDIFFLIRGDIVTTDFLEKLRTKLSDAKFVMYQWDSMRHTNYEEKIKYFDRVLTFDMVDAKEYRVEYLPLFYTDLYGKIATKKQEKKVDLVFVGAYHSDRLQIVKYIFNEFKKNGLIFEFHIYITKLALLRLLVTGKLGLKDLFFLKTNSVPSDYIVKQYSKSVAALDIEMFIQNGLTIRTFEVLGSNLKLVTTNQNIVNEGFYNSERIMVIDRYNIRLNLLFFQFADSGHINMDVYHIDSWLQKILG